MKRERIRESSDVFKTAAHWRMQGEEMRTLAEEARDPVVRTMMLRIAADYDRLARHADDSASQDAMMLRTAADYDQLTVTLDARPANGKKP